MHGPTVSYRVTGFSAVIVNGIQYLADTDWYRCPNSVKQEYWPLRIGLSDHTAVIRMIKHLRNSV